MNGENDESNDVDALERFERLVSSEWKRFGVFAAALLVTWFTGLEPTLQNARRTLRSLSVINSKIQDGENLARQIARPLILEESEIRALEDLQKRYPTPDDRAKARAQLVSLHQAAVRVNERLAGATNKAQVSDILRSLQFTTNRNEPVFLMAIRLGVRLDRIGGEQTNVQFYSSQLADEIGSKLEAWDEKVAGLPTLKNRRENLVNQRAEAEVLLTGLQSERAVLLKKAEERDARVAFELFGLNLQIPPIPAGIIWLGVSLSMLASSSFGRCALERSLGSLAEDTRRKLRGQTPIGVKVICPDLFTDRSVAGALASIGLPLCVLVLQIRVAWILIEIHRFQGNWNSWWLLTAAGVVGVLLNSWLLGWWIFGIRWEQAQPRRIAAWCVAGACLAAAGFAFVAQHGKGSDSVAAFHHLCIWAMLGAWCGMVLVMARSVRLPERGPQRIGSVGLIMVSRRGVFRMATSSLVMLAGVSFGLPALIARLRRTPPSPPGGTFFACVEERSRAVVFHHSSDERRKARRRAQTYSDTSLSAQEGGSAPILLQIRAEPRLGSRETTAFVSGYVQHAVKFVGLLGSSPDASYRWIRRLMEERAAERWARLETVSRIFTVANGALLRADLLVSMLRQPSEPFAQYLVGRLSAGIREKLADPRSPWTAGERLRPELLAWLNHLVTGESLARAALKAGLALGTESARLATPWPEGACMARLNRFVLSDTLPEIVARPTVNSNACDEVDLVDELTEAINRIVEGNSVLDDDAPWTDSEIPAEIQRVLERGGTGVEQQRANLQLIAQAFPRFVRLRPLPRRRVALSEASRAFESEVLNLLAKGVDVARTDMACRLLLSGLVHDAIYKDRVSGPTNPEYLSFRLYDLLAGLCVRFRHHEHFASLLAFVERLGPEQRILFRDRVAKWTDPRGAWRFRWRDRETPIKWSNDLGWVVF
ncbi:MAG: hypothetical protein JNK85_28750 [Verrucomicrobiales bacterium]|nr:hypothetical protein [Verrucomicrobiales bacterium]